ncbi:MAG: bile acid:sodium symporter [Peptococcaceae bacterium]|nr:bile acid:sodium symporter [Peptococcaceae bacterium]
MNLQGIAKFFDKNMIYLIALSILSGAAVGWFAPEFSKGLKEYINFTLFLMIFPMMVGIRVEETVKAAKNLRPISLSLLLNFVISPLMGFLVALAAFRGHPDFAAALLLLSVTPCAGMVAGWTGFAKGNVALALVIVALSLTLSILTIPVSMLILAHSLISIDALAMFKGTILVILIPMIAGDITRRLIIKAKGEQGFMNVRPVLPPLSMLGMFGIVFISMALGAPRIVSIWHSIFIIVPAILVFYILQFAVSVWLARRAKLPAKDEIALIYSVTGKNISLAIGLASQFFSPLTVVMLAVNPLIQMPVMAWILRWSPSVFRREKAMQ